MKNSASFKVGDRVRGHVSLREGVIKEVRGDMLYVEGKDKTFPIHISNVDLISPSKYKIVATLFGVEQPTPNEFLGEYYGGEGIDIEMAESLISVWNSACSKSLKKIGPLSEFLEYKTKPVYGND